MKQETARQPASMVVHVLVDLAPSSQGRAVGVVYTKVRACMRLRRWLRGLARTVVMRLSSYGGTMYEVLFREVQESVLYHIHLSSRQRFHTSSGNIFRCDVNRRFQSHLFVPTCLSPEPFTFPSTLQIFETFFEIFSGLGNFMHHPRIRCARPPSSLSVTHTTKNTPNGGDTSKLIRSSQETPLLPCVRGFAIVLFVLEGQLRQVPCANTCLLLATTTVTC